MEVTKIEKIDKLKMIMTLFFLRKVGLRLFKSKRLVNKLIEKILRKSFAAVVVTTDVKIFIKTVNS